MTATVPVHTLILSHANVDFDAFAGMLAAQLLYPGARICLHGGVNRNVREFYNLHADQIPAVEPSAVDHDSVRRAGARRGHERRSRLGRPSASSAGVTTSRSSPSTTTVTAQPRGKATRWSARTAAS